MGMAEKRSTTEMKGRKPRLITKTLDRCRSTPVRRKPAEGCFSVYVGAGRQRFVVHTECLNHPLFRTLLEEAEEFGYVAAGPLELPCDAEAFARVLEQIEEEKQRAAGLARRNPTVCLEPASLSSWADPSICTRLHGGRVDALYVSVELIFSSCHVHIGSNLSIPNYGEQPHHRLVNVRDILFFPFSIFVRRQR
ncbi:hypothetical protein ACQ4PT_048614 [Festuca glaucescens]